MLAKFRSGCLTLILLMLGLAPMVGADPTTRPEAADVLLATVSMKGPLVLHLPGIGGPRMCDHRMLAGLRDGGVAANFVICDWTENNTGIAALQGYAHNHEEAKKIAELIVAHAAADPNSPMDITAHSGGCGLAVWALEDLPPGINVRTVLLIAPALSPNYDLTAALRHVEGDVYVFSSTLDTVVLQTGTKLFGTIDGVQTAAAGFGGFVKPPGADAQMYEKVISRPYQHEWVRYNDYGDHIGAMSRPFGKAVLAPLIASSMESATSSAEPATRPSDEGKSATP